MIYVWMLTSKIFNFLYKTCNKNFQLMETIDPCALQIFNYNNRLRSFSVSKMKWNEIKECFMKDKGWNLNSKLLCVERKRVKSSSNSCYLAISYGIKSNIFYFQNIYMCNNTNYTYYAIIIIINMTMITMIMIIIITK